VRPRWLTFIIETWERFDRHGDLLAAAISFYTLLSLAPLVVIAIHVASLLVDRAEARGTLLNGMSDLTSPELAATVGQLTDAVDRQGGGVAAILAGVMLLWAASRLFLQIQEALNLIWGVRTKDSASVGEAVKRFVTKRLVSFAMVLACGALLLSMLIAQAVLATVGDAVERWLGGTITISPWLFLLGVSYVMIAMVFRVLPDAKVRWRDVWVGSAVTTVLVLAGTALLGLYLTRIAPAWLQGAAGSLAAFMLWAYYLAQVFLLGASFTRTWSARDGQPLIPEPLAELDPGEQDSTTAAR
jgi:membrane protein